MSDQSSSECVVLTKSHVTNLLFIMSSTTLCMHPPCLKDLTTPDETLPTTEVALTMLFEVEFMIAEVRRF